MNQLCFTLTNNKSFMTKENMMTEIERLLTTSPVECRSMAGKPRTIGGYAAVFDSESRMLPGGFVERVSKSFFNKARGDGWPGAGGLGVTANYDHKSEFMLGNTRSGTLELTIDSRGLLYSVALPESRSDIYELVDRGDVAGSSFSFNVFDDSWDYVHGATLRVLISGNLLDCGPTSTPAYTSSTATAYRSFARQFDADPAEVERDFRNGNTRRYFERTNIMPKPTDMPPTTVEVANRNVKEDHGMDTDLSLRRLRNEAQMMAAQGDSRALNRLEGKPDGGDLDLRRRILALHERKARMDAGMIAELDRQRDAYQQPDAQAAHDAQQRAIYQETLRRRLNQLHQDGVDLPDTGVGATYVYGPAWPETPVQRQPEVNGGWIGT
jgi:uncharacterized protein